jgi:transcriptional regulator with XRE-family HTH domain
MMGNPSLKQWRHARQLSARELAERAGVSLSTIARIEQGATHPRAYIAHHLADALGTTPGLVAELADAIPRLGTKWPELTTRDDLPRDRIDEPHFPVGAPPHEATDEGS